MKTPTAKSIKAKTVKARIDGESGGIVVRDGVGNTIRGAYVGSRWGIRPLGYNLLTLYHTALKNDLLRSLEWNLTVMECDTERESGGELLPLNIHTSLLWLLQHFFVLPTSVKRTFSSEIKLFVQFGDSEKLTKSSLI